MIYLYDQCKLESSEKFLDFKEFPLANFSFTMNKIIKITVLLPTSTGFHVPEVPRLIPSLKAIPFNAHPVNIRPEYNSVTFINLMLQDFVVHKGTAPYDLEVNLIKDQGNYCVTYIYTYEHCSENFGNME